MSQQEGRQGRLNGKVAIITGGAGNIGEIITRCYLAEGATVVITGRTEAKLEQYRHRLIEGEQISPERIITVAFDGSNMQQVRMGIDTIIAKAGRIDILVNNAGTAGPRRRLIDVPIQPNDLRSPDTETLSQAVGNLLSITWNMTRAVAPHMQPGSSIVNVSTIFSRTDYYGRIPYVVPKAALNALSEQCARELGAQGIRVNTIYPGPIDSERIRTVFKSMDELKGIPDGTTANGFFDIMRLSRTGSTGELEKGFPKPVDVADSVVFLGSDEAAAYSGHIFEVTNGMDVPVESRTTLVAWPERRNIQFVDEVVLICAGDQIDDSLHLAQTLKTYGAKVALAFRDGTTLDAVEESMDSQELLLCCLSPHDPSSVGIALDRVRATCGDPNHVVVLPAHNISHYHTVSSKNSAHLTEADDTSISQFLEDEITGVMSLASQLMRHWQNRPPVQTPHIIFASNGDDGHNNVYAKVLSAALEQLVRVWRHESTLDAARHASNGTQTSTAIRAHQLIRYTNDGDKSRDYAHMWIADLLANQRDIEEINLVLPKQIAPMRGAHRSLPDWAENLYNLHRDKVALVTGGSSGIGGEIGRLLALSGAYVMLAARGADQLNEAREAIVREVHDAGYPNAEKRVRVIANCDVADSKDLERLAEYTIETFGHVDYLFNNAGISGAEEMVIDMPLESWRHTLQANLISNYTLIRKLAPLMKAQERGYILNVSSYFGGEKYVAIPYPNRSDYAVSKAGQRAMVETLARFLGPQVQINALAPGPVEGDRLRGTGERPGLFARRGRLILQNKRLNELYAAIVEAHSSTGRSIADMLPLIFANDVMMLMRSVGDIPDSLQRMAATIWERSDPSGSSRMYLMNEKIAQKLIRRLETSGYLHYSQENNAKEGVTMEILPKEAVAVATPSSPPDTTSGRRTETISEQSFTTTSIPIPQLTNIPTEPFFTFEQIEREAQKVHKGIIGMLYLQRMPTELEVAKATIYYLADHNVSGETFHPSGGLRFERTVTEGELFGKGRPERIARFRDNVVYLIGEHMQKHLIRLTQVYLDDLNAKRVVLLTETAEAADAIMATMPAHRDSGRLCAIATNGNIEQGIDAARATFGSPGPVISMPFRSIPQRALVAKDGDWSDVLSEQEFSDLVEDQITHHFRVTQKISLMDGAQLVLITPETTARSTEEEFALANFVKTTLHALTATVGAESERTMPHVPVNQVDLTRRARSEEPRNAVEEEEELIRFVHAVLLTSAPLPKPSDSRYRARIYRGNAITV
ncbi:MAG: hypothetical protein GFH27_549319n17 [Chloroflexi bacterium AL-W]|nr:hypothetical protein [Chloroflexi bacterium AL-N1]NOK70563.1 hypothetical protein [Chloroflexi bacterium AL-N10]NOK77555.1 hypothetical protein [Chloroflexi bacterium AL-N5]NOK84406.1 hypothetical protein [Chloroflexi bacterium AL-W]NOK92295.1 hypothetical protein [Chloroflexi bacterium AL-N15]